MDQLKNFLAAWKDALSALQSIATMAALLVGGLWAYFKLFKGRTYTRRLEPAIEIKKTIFTDDYSCLIMKVSIKNVGLTRVDIDMGSSTIDVMSYARDDYEPEFHNALWNKIGVVEALQHHAWVEPGELVTEERLIALPNRKLIAVGLRLRLLPKLRARILWRRRTEWNALAVAPLEGSQSPTTGLQVR